LEKIAEATQNMLFIYNFKKAVLDFCKDKFSVTSYYSQKAKLSMPDGLKNVKKAVAPKEKGSKHFSALVKWREQVADNYNVEEREIISTKTLQEIANKKPHTSETLLAIKGMGGKAKKYAKDILTVLRNLGEDIPQTELEEAEYESLSTQEKTLRLYLNGRSVQRISQDRKISVETVLGHLAKYVVSGEVSAESLISAERLEELAGFIRKYPNLTDKEIVSGNKFSYGEIKIARAYLEQ
jgi:ribonuclease D